MKLRVHSDTGELLVDHDLTGAKWMSAGNGFVNIDTVVAVVCATGVAGGIGFYDDLGTKIMDGRIGQINITRVEEGHHIVFSPGELMVSLHLAESKTDSKYLLGFDTADPQP